MDAVQQALQVREIGNKKVARKSPHQQGFSLLELVVVLAGLGILSSLALPNFMRLLDFNNIDEAKALLNTAAADCLQKSRLNDVDSRDLIDDEILSDKRLNTIGYKIDSDAQNCSYLQISPTNEEDNLRYPIGFSVSEGNLSKFANPTSTDQASISSCENWAGVNCKQDESLKELIEWKNSIAAAKTTCEDSYSNWLSGGTTPFEYDRWNPNAESGCPSRPPQDGTTPYKTSNTCTPNGCNRTVYGLDGDFVGFTKEDYDRALEAKYGKICSEWVAEKEAENYTNDPLDQPLTKLECGAREFWFVEGEDQGSEADLLARLDEIASGICVAEREQARKDGYIGQWGPKEGPLKCSEESYICNSLLFLDQAGYIKCLGTPPSHCKLNSYPEPDEECRDYDGSNYIVNNCMTRSRSKNQRYDCRESGTGMPPQSVYNTPGECQQWLTCAGYLER